MPGLLRPEELMGTDPSGVGWRKSMDSSQCSTGTSSALCIVTKVRLGPASVRCQPADHSPPHLHARLSMCECLHPHGSLLRALHSRAYREEACHKALKWYQQIQTFSFVHTAKCIWGSCLSHIHCPVRSRRWQTTLPPAPPIS